MATDWTKTLWPTSYGGVPFWVERDKSPFGRRVAVHQFPMRDDPFIEDLGASAVYFDITAYLVGDTSDTDSENLVSALSGASGPGTLVLPLDGQVNANFIRGERAREKDKLGYIAFDLHFVRSGAAAALTSAPYASQLAFDAVTALGAAMDAISGMFSVEDGPGWVADAAIDALQDTPASLEAIRAQGSVSTSQNLSIKQSIASFFSSIPALVSQTGGVDPSIPSTAASLAVTLADALPAASAAISFGAAYDALPPSMAPVATATPNVQLQQANAAAAARLIRLTMLSGYVEGVLQMTFASRSDGVAARSALVARFANELSQSMGAANVPLAIALASLRSAAVSYLTQLIATLRPVVTVTAPRSLPSLWWAWRLYQDPTQAPALVARNKIRHPSFCPPQLEVLAPGSISITAPI